MNVENVVTKRYEMSVFGSILIHFVKVVYLLFDFYTFLAFENSEEMMIINILVYYLHRLC